MSELQQPPPASRSRGGRGGGRGAASGHRHHHHHDTADPAQGTTGVALNPETHVEVYASDFSRIYLLPRADVYSGLPPTDAAAASSTTNSASASHPQPHAGKQILRLCPDFDSVKGPASCPRGAAQCQRVHAVLHNATSSPVHVNFAYDKLDDCRYPRGAPGSCPPLSVVKPEDKGGRDEIPPEHLIRTRALDERREVYLHCAHYYFNRICNRGAECGFVHVVSSADTKMWGGKLVPANFTDEDLLQLLDHKSHKQPVAPKNKQQQQQQQQQQPQQLQQAAVASSSQQHGSKSRHGGSRAAATAAAASQHAQQQQQYAVYPPQLIDPYGAAAAAAAAAYVFVAPPYAAHPAQFLPGQLQHDALLLQHLQYQQQLQLQQQQQQQLLLTPSQLLLLQQQYHHQQQPEQPQFQFPQHAAVQQQQQQRQQPLRDSGAAARSTHSTPTSSPRQHSFPAQQFGANQPSQQRQGAALHQYDDDNRSNGSFASSSLGSHDPLFDPSSIGHSSAVVTSEQRDGSSSRNAAGAAPPAFSMTPGGHAIAPDSARSTNSDNSNGGARRVPKRVMNLCDAMFFDGGLVGINSNVCTSGFL